MLARIYNNSPEMLKQYLKINQTNHVEIWRNDISGSRRNHNLFTLMLCREESIGFEEACFSTKKEAKAYYQAYLSRYIPLA